jgi:hypothetical protein
MHLGPSGQVEYRRHKAVADLAGGLSRAVEAHMLGHLSDDLGEHAGCHVLALHVPELTKISVQLSGLAPQSQAANRPALTSVTWWPCFTARPS